MQAQSAPRPLHGPLRHPTRRVAVARTPAGISGVSPWTDVSPLTTPAVMTAVTCKATAHYGGDVLSALGVDGGSVQICPAVDLLAAIRMELMGKISSRVKGKGKARLAELMVLLGESTSMTDSMSKSEIRQYLWYCWANRPA